MLKQYVVRVGHIRDALEFFVRWNKHHRTCQAAVDELQQGMQQLQQPQHDGTEGVMVATVLDALLSTAPDGDCSARQTCEHLQDSAAVDGVAVPGTIDVATRVPPPAHQVGDVSAVVSPADGRRIALHQHFTCHAERAARHHRAPARGFQHERPARCGRRGRGGVGRRRAGG